MTAVMITRASRVGCIITETARAKSALVERCQVACTRYASLVLTHPPEIPMNVSAKYRHLPARKVVIMHDNSQTARNDLELRGADVDIAGTIRDRNVEKCTGPELGVNRATMASDVPPNAWPAASPPTPPSRNQ